MMFISTWRNSIGDLVNFVPPNHSFWLNEWYSETTQDTMIGMIWLFWFFNHVIILIILLNVLIAILSDSFELAMSQQVVNKYTNRVSINKEVTTFYNEPEMVDCIVVSIMKEGDSEEDWSGFVDSIKTFIKK